MKIPVQEQTSFRMAFYLTPLSAYLSVSAGVRLLYCLVINYELGNQSRRLTAEDIVK